MKVVNVSYGQSLVDIAHQEYGAYEGVFLLLEDNAGYELDSVLPQGATINVRDTVEELNKSNLLVAERFAAENRRVNMVNTVPDPAYVEDEYVEDDYVI